MVNVRLAKEWTDSKGKTHQPGAMVEVDAATLADLEKRGIIAEPDGSWAGPTGSWAGPTGGTTGGTAS